MNMFGNMFGGIFGESSPFRPIEDKCCKLTMKGETAIKTPGGYKVYRAGKDGKVGKLVNAANLVMDGCFFSIPTTKVSPGDIILVNSQPRCVVSVDESNTEIKVINYFNNSLEVILPERHEFMGNFYCYIKIMNPFASTFASGEGMQNMMQMAMMSQMFGGANTNNGMSNMLPFMLMSGKDNMFTNMFGDMFKSFDLSNDAELAEEDNKEE